MKILAHHCCMNFPNELTHKTWRVFVGGDVLNGCHRLIRDSQHALRELDHERFKGQMLIAECALGQCWLGDHILLRVDHGEGNNWFDRLGTDKCENGNESRGEDLQEHIEVEDFMSKDSNDMANIRNFRFEKRRFPGI